MFLLILFQVPASRSSYFTVVSFSKHRGTLKYTQCLLAKDNINTLEQKKNTPCTESFSILNFFYINMVLLSIT